MRFSHALIGLPFAIAWMMITAQVNAEGFVVGYILSLGLARFFLPGATQQLNIQALPGQFTALLMYAVLLSWDILRSGVDVLLRVIGIRPVNPGIAAVEVQHSDETIEGLSAHGITITPGQLVVDFDQEKHLIFVHCLDMDGVDAKLHAEQTRRLKYLRRILNR